MSNKRDRVYHKDLIVFCSVHFAGWQFYLLLKPWNRYLNVLKSSTKILCTITEMPTPLFKYWMSLWSTNYHHLCGRVFASRIRRSLNIWSAKLYFARMGIYIRVQAVEELKKAREGDGVLPFLPYLWSAVGS